MKRLTVITMTGLEIRTLRRSGITNKDRWKAEYNYDSDGWVRKRNKNRLEDESLQQGMA